MNNLLKRLLTAGLITTMLTIPAVVFADIAVTAHEAPAYAASCYSTAEAPAYTTSTYSTAEASEYTTSCYSTAEASFKGGTITAVGIEDEAYPDTTEADTSVHTIKTITAPAAQDINADPETVSHKTNALKASADAAETEVIIAGQMPVTNINGAWALVNLLATIVTVIIATITVIFSRKRKDEKETKGEGKHEQKTNHNTFLQVLGVITAIVSVIAFILTEHMSHLMQLTDNWTMVMILLLALEALLGLISKETTDEEEEQAEQSTSETKLA